MGLDQAHKKASLSMSQPALDISDKFDIPSPPPVAANKLESPFTFPRQSQTSVPMKTQPEAAEPLTNSPVLVNVHKKPSKAPIASIPELQLDDEEPTQDNSSERDASSSGAVTHTESTCAVTQAANRPPIVVDTSDHKEPFNSGACENKILQRDATVVTSSGGPLPEGVGSYSYVTGTEARPALAADSATSPQESTLCHVETSVPETAKSVSVPSGVSCKNTDPVGQDTVYGELYDSLLPPGFTSELISSGSNPVPEIQTEVKHLNTKSELAWDRSLNKCQAESNVIYSHLSTSLSGDGKDNTESSCTNMRANKTQLNVSSSGSSRGSAASDLQKESDIYHRYLPSSLSAASKPDAQDAHDSELSRSHSEVKSKYSLIQKAVRSVPEVETCAPPVSDYVTSHGADTQVTNSKRRVILVKELVVDEASANRGCPYPVPDKMSTVRDLEIKTESPSGHVDGYEGLLSPAYLSVGSDDGSAMEIYYSAEEDNSEQSGDEDMNTMDQRGDSCRVDGVEEVELREERMEIVETQNEEAQGGSDEDDFSRQTEVHQELKGQKAEAQGHKTGTSEFLVSNDGRSQQKAGATAALLPTKEGEEGRKEELLVAPVGQVNTLMVCKVIPPFTEPHGQGEGLGGNWTQTSETEAPLNGERSFPSQEIQYLTHKDVARSEYTHAASSKSRNEDVITPTFRRAEEEEQALETADERREASRKSGEATTNALSDAVAGVGVVTGSVAHGAELQSDAIETEHNKAPRRSEWAETITQSTDKNRTAQEQVAVELSPSDRGTHLPDTEAAQVISERHQHPPEAQPALDQG